ncbi:MAG: protein-L-isoaspartate(D-aspartate) O-methyltransferase [Rhizobiaceae bacterium]
MSGQGHSFPEAIVALMLRLRELGIVAPEFLKLIESVRHEQFVPVQYFDQAWKPQTFPLPCGQTMLSPDTSIRLVDALNVEPSHSVLEIGTGSGYQTALLARLAKKVFSIDRYQSLLDDAKERLDRLGLSNVTLVKADGTIGPVGQGLYDRIIIDSSFDSMPRFLLEQLVSGAVVVTAIGPPDGEQMAVRLTKIGSRFDRVDLFPVRCSPLEKGLARAL